MKQPKPRQPWDAAPAEVDVCGREGQTAWRWISSVSEEAVTLGKEDLRDCGSGRGSVCLGWGSLGVGGRGLVRAWSVEGVVRVRVWSEGVVW